MTERGTYKFETLDAAGNVCCGSDTPDSPRCPRCSGKAMNQLAPRPAVPSQPVVRKTPSEWRDHFGQLLRGYGSVQTETPPDPYGIGLRKGGRK